MKKKIITIIIAVCLVTALVPMVSSAAVTPYFFATNDTLLPFNNDTMPYVSGGVIYVPPDILREVNVWNVSSIIERRLRIYISSEKYVDFYTDRGITEDQNGNVLSWPSALMINNRFYAPLSQVCDYFGLTSVVLNISRDVIPQEQMRLIRIRPTVGFSGLNDATFMGLGTTRTALRNAYNDYYAPPPPTSPPPTSPGETHMPPPSPEPPQRYNDVMIHHSFFDVSAGGAGIILELLSTNAAQDYRFCFFVTADDIINNAGFIRRITGSGHTIGIWLTEGTYSEYLEISALLFEAAKIKTVLVSGDSEALLEFELAEDNRVILWETQQSLAYDETLSVDEVIATLPQQSGERQNLLASCSEFTALMLSGILSYLRENEYSIVGITETTTPI